MFRSKNFAVTGLIGFFLFAPMPVRAATVEYDLTIAQQKLDIIGKPAVGMTINGDIPGSTLRFKEGNIARIRVHNKMTEATSIHWHGLLVPPGMDGVPYISFPPIQPGETFTYEFPIRQNGTYWYHSHSGLQEQSGMYGAIVIEPQVAVRDVDREYVIVLSDWTDEDPHEVNRTLKRGSEWYAIEKGSGQSIFGAARLDMLGDYMKRELQRMPPMDIADVAYQRFLGNGKPGSDLSAVAGETVRLRVINGSATTYFHVDFAGGPMVIVAADGLDVRPVDVDRFLIAVAETYDVLVHVPDTEAYEFRVTAHDGSGCTSVWLGSGIRHSASDVPRPNLYHTMGGLSLKRIFALTPAGTMDMPDQDIEAGKFDRPGMMDIHQIKMNKMHGLSHKDSMSMAERQGHTAHAAPHGEPGHNHVTHVEHASPEKSARQHTGGIDAASRSCRDGKRYAKIFGVLAADVSSSKDLAFDGMDPRRP